MYSPTCCAFECEAIRSTACLNLSIQMKCRLRVKTPRGGPASIEV